MTEEDLAKLLGRNLTSEETANFDMYLEIATDKLEMLLCTTLTGEGVSGEEPTARSYEARQGYSTLFTDIFLTVDSITIDGEEVDLDDVEYRQFDNLNGSWFNSIVFDRRFTRDKVVVVTADWGFETVPADLKLLWARLFDNVSQGQSTDGRVKSQRIDDAQVTFADTTISEQLIKDNRSTINKYSICGVGNVKHGKVGHWHGHI